MSAQAFGDADALYMARALALAERGLFTATPNPRVGCVIVDEGRIVGEGWHEKAGGPHAEIAAMRDAEGQGRDVRGATLYVTLEPCNHTGRTPPCTEALVAAGLDPEQELLRIARDRTDAKAAGSVPHFVAHETQKS